MSVQISITKQGRMQRVQCTVATASWQKYLYY